MKKRQTSYLLSGLGVYSYAVVPQGGNLLASFPRYGFEPPKGGIWRINMRIKRQNAILKLIGENSIETQQELTDALREMGYDVTQATVSRDIKELRILKRLNDAGRYVYAQSGINSDADMNERFNIIFEKSVVSIEYAVNNIVVKTLSGMAQAAAAALDAMDFPEVVGTIAGDDTIFMVVRSEESARRLVYKLRSMAE